MTYQLIITIYLIRLIKPYQGIFRFLTFVEIQPKEIAFFSFFTAILGIDMNIVDIY